MATGGPHLLVFGSQTPLPSADKLASLRSTLLNEPDLQGLAAAVAELPVVWHDLVLHDSDLQAVPGDDLLSCFSAWINEGAFRPTSIPGTENIANLLLTPLTVILHLVDYFSFLKTTGASHERYVVESNDTSFVGFCTGMLAASTLSAAKDTKQLILTASSALRLAVAIGAYVDLNEGFFSDPPRETACIAVRWKDAGQKVRLDGELGTISEAYVSVITDTNTITVTAPKQERGSLIQKFSALGLSARTISLHGCFHSSTQKGFCERLLSLAASDRRFRFPGSELHGEIVRSMLVEQFDWYSRASTAMQNLAGSHSAESEKKQIISFGLHDPLPRSLVNDHGSQLRIEHWTGSVKDDVGKVPSPESPYSPSDDAIAIVGLSCRFPGADDLDEFWELLKSGASMLGDLPPERFPTEGLRRTPKDDIRFMGNFLRDGFAFDHKFFGRSSRESASMDPQHKLILQVAYEALESAGYFSSSSYESVRDVGCYVGVAASDYEDNVASHAPTAFSVPGMVRAFVSGKVSHFFGFSGPALVFDTACSSSAVAIHTACQAIKSGDCSMALAGGVNVITSPVLHQNLAAANFLTPTGASKAFDSRADGYCRGEGAGLVVLKRYSAAVADGDQIHGVLLGSAVNQNKNDVSITVPVSESQTSVYGRVLQRAHMDPAMVSFVEAHGTGTPKGDPIESKSIRDVFGAKSNRKLYFGSVKGSIGHTEAASGVAGLIKVLLMMRHRMITPQASFEELNPAIPSLEQDNMEIARTPQPWKAKFLAACVNNYGAAGSNAALLVCQAPEAQSMTETNVHFAKEYPFFVAAKSGDSLQYYCKALASWLERQMAKTSTSDQQKLLAGVTAALAQRTNLGLLYACKGTVDSTDNLLGRLREMANKSNAGAAPQKDEIAKRNRPVVLVFSGQTANTVSISTEAFQQSCLLQHHLGHCDRILRKMGLNGILPEIFEQKPITDVVQLHCSMFAVQYACAKAWLDSGLRVAKLIGHSLGQLTALCVGGAMSLENGLKLIAGRAELITRHWGPERGTMYTVEAQRAETEKLVQQAQGAGIEVEVACYNARSKHVVVGSTDSISKFEDFVSSKNIRGKRLEVAYGFHSPFVDNIMPGYRKLLEEIEFYKPKIPIETCSQGSSWKYVSATLVAEQSRKPVYYTDAVERIRQEHGPCVWLEAGSATAAIPLSKGALQGPGEEVSQNSFHKVDLSGADPMSALAATTLGLWDRGTRVQFWPFHRSQRHLYPTVMLPPYQFEKHHHRLEYIDRHETEKPAADKTATETAFPPPPTMVSFEGYSDDTKTRAVFNVDPSVQDFQALIKGHAVLGSPLCPVSLYIEMASRAAALITHDFSVDKYAPYMEDLEILAPLGLDEGRRVQLSLEKLEELEWQFTVTSSPSSQGQKTRKTRHASATFRLNHSSDKRSQVAMQRYERLISFEGAESLLSEPHASAMQGPLVYRLFDRVVEYSYIYRGVQRISSTKQRVSALVKLILDGENIEYIKNKSLVNSLAIDNFTQVAGLQVNGMEDCGQDEVFIASQIEELQMASTFNKDSDGPWVVYSNCRQGGERELLHDIFVFDATTKSLVMTILGIKFTRTKISFLSKILGKASSAVPDSVPAPATGKQVKAASKPKSASPSKKATVNRGKAENNDKANAALVSDLKQLLQDTADVSPDEIEPDSVLTEVGIDSLMANEVLTAIEQKFSVSLSASEFQDCENFESLYRAISTRCGDSSPTLTSESSSVDGDESTEQASQVGESVTAASSVTEEDSGELRGALHKLLSEHLDVPQKVPRDLVLSEAGLDSLSGTELTSDIEKTFGQQLDLSDFETVGDLEDVIAPKTAAPRTPKSKSKAAEAVTTSDSDIVTHKANSASSSRSSSSEGIQMLSHAIEDFKAIRSDYLRFAEEAGWAGFRDTVYPKQRQLVFSYVLEAFDGLGCKLGSMKAGQALPDIPHLARHEKVLGQYFKVLRDEALIYAENGKWTRSAVPVPEPRPNSDELFEEMLTAFPKFSSELKILNATGSRLAEILDGKVDPLGVLFKTKTDRDLMTDVYTNTPMFKTGNMVLENFLTTTLPKSCGAGKLQILELGAGTGGTTAGVLEKLEKMGIDFSYTFSDLSSSLVAAAKKRFARYGSSMEYAIVDVEKEPPESLAERYHIIISSNCIHATKDLGVSSTNLRKMLRPQDGMVCLLELTRNLYWLDCVFGTLEGWWLFQDTRQHVLASEQRWKETLLNAGFTHVDWSDDDSQESDQFRVVVGFTSPPTFNTIPGDSDVINRTDWMTTTETVEYYEVDGTPLEADIYYPEKPDSAGLVRPIALMIHGGGHVMLSRKDIRPKQTALLLERGFLPVSVDYRLCPESTLPNGPMADVSTALQWCRNSLPGLLPTLARPDVQADGARVVAVGWSTGGTLAMTLAFTAPAPPDAVLAFYCPTDYEDPFWAEPNFPERTRPAEAEREYDLLEGVRDRPIVGYNVPPEKRAAGGWMSTTDARSRIALHMNWKGQALPTLLDGLPSKRQLENGEWKEAAVKDWKQRPIPAVELIRAVSPYAQILAGNYKVPTFLIHGTKDDLIPFQHSQRVRDALLERGVDAGVAVPEGAVHLFDLYREDERGQQARAVLEGYDFLCPHVGIPVP